MYEILSNQRLVKAEDWKFKSTLADSAKKSGQWVEQDSSGMAVQGNNSTTALTSQKGIIRPLWSGNESPDSQETGNGTTVYGEHEALTDGFADDPTTGTYGTRSAWARSQPVVVVKGVLVPFKDGTDKDFSIVGYVKELADSDGRMRFHIY